MTQFIDERPNYLSQAQRIKKLAVSGAKLNSESSASSNASSWKCPDILKDFFHGGITSKNTSKASRPGPPLFGSLYLHLTPEILSALPSDLNTICVEIHFSLSCNRSNGKMPFYPIDKEIPIFGHRGAFFYLNDDSVQTGNDVNECQERKGDGSGSDLYFIAGPCTNAGYLGATVPSSQVFMPIMGLHLDTANPSTSYIAAPRTVMQWKLSIVIKEEWISSIGDKFTVISSAMSLPSQVNEQTFTL